jgi:hypothetical protein
MEKRRLVIDYKNLSPELLASLKLKYPHGYQNFVMKVSKPNGDFFYAITLDTADASYLVKVPVKIDTKIKDEDDEKALFSESDDIGTSEDSFPEEEAEDKADDYGDEADSGDADEDDDI